MLPAEATRLPAARAIRAQVVDLTPPLLIALLLVFLADVVIRRWDSVQGLWEAVRDFRQRT